MIQLRPADRLLADYLECCRAPSLAGLKAVGNMVTLPKAVWMGLLPRVFAVRPNLAGWQLALGSCWCTSSAAVVAAAGCDRERLAAWFGYADLRRPRLPYLRAIFATDLPETQIMFRGGQGDPGELARGLSWTPDLCEAAHYAFTRTVRPGPPAIVRRIIHRDEIAMQLLNESAETVVLTPGDAAVVPITAAQRNRLLKKSARRFQRLEAWKARVLAAPESEILAGWTGGP